MMTAKKKPATARKRTNRRTSAASAITDGINKVAILKTFANYGAAGIFGGWLLVVTLPEAQKSFTDAIKQQSENSDMQRQRAMEHGERAVEKISSAVDRLGDKFGAVQATTQQNQSRLIDEQRKTNELLSGKKIAPVPNERGF